MPDRSEDLAVLFRRANVGDEDAYLRLLQALAPMLRGFVRRGLLRAYRSPDDCEDIVQETLIAVHVKRHTWDETQPLEPWVHAIARYKLIDFLRRRGGQEHLLIDDLADVLAAEPDRDVVQAVDRQRALDRLPQRQRQIVEAFAIEGRSAREVAEALGTTEGAVRVALHRALRAMGDNFRRGST